MANAILWGHSDTVNAPYISTLLFTMKAALRFLTISLLSTLCLMASCTTAFAASVLYVHGDVAGDGTVPSGNQQPFDQMLLTDTGSKGLSEFADLVRSQGHTISQRYDQQTSINDDFLSDVDVLIFGLHQKQWSDAEKESLHNWLNAGGGMLIYSDSASGGSFSSVGAQNSVGQSVTNNLIERYGMQVTVDQANGTKSFRSGPSIPHPLMNDRPELEGEGVSPIAIDPNSNAIALIPHSNDPDNLVSGNTNIPHTQNVSINNPQYAALALATVGDGHVIALFDRQPMWNSGPGSNIEKRDNREILRRIVNFLGQDSTTSPTTPNSPRSSGDPSAAGTIGALMLLLDIL